MSCREDGDWQPLEANPRVVSLQGVRLEAYQRVCDYPLEVDSRNLARMGSNLVRRGRAACVRNYTSSARGPSPFVARAPILIVFDGTGPCRAGPVHCNSPILSVLDPGTPLCKPVIAAWKSCGARSSESQNHPGAREEENGAQPR